MTNQTDSIEEVRDAIEHLNIIALGDKIYTRDIADISILINLAQRVLNGELKTYKEWLKVEEGDDCVADCALVKELRGKVKPLEVMGERNYWNALCWDCKKIYRIEVGTRTWKCSCGKYCDIRILRQDNISKPQPLAQTMSKEEILQIICREYHGDDAQGRLAEALVGKIAKSQTMGECEVEKIVELRLELLSKYIGVSSFAEENYKIIAKDVAKALSSRIKAGDNEGGKK